MSATPQVIESSLGELASVAAKEHQAAMKKGLEMLSHAIHAGEALLAAREQVPRGGWLGWLEKHFPATPATANNYMRIAYYKAELPKELRNVSDAMYSLRGLPGITGTSPQTRYDDDLKETARRLSRSGLPGKEIASRLGVPQPTVSTWVSGSAKQRERDRARALKEGKRALERKKRDKAFKDHPLSDCYFPLRQAMTAMDVRADRTEDAEERAALRRMISRCQQAEGELVGLLGNVAKIEEGVLR